MSNDTPQFVTKADLSELVTKGELHKELHALTWRFLGFMLALQVPTWIGVMQIWAYLANIAAHLPK